MRKVALSLGLVGFIATQSFAGSVLFSPSPQDGVIRGETVTFDLTLQAGGTVPTISGGDIVVGSSIPFSFAYSSAFTAAMPNITAPGPVGVYANDFLVGGSNPTTGAGASLLLGTVTVQTGGLADGTYTVEVNSDTDGFSNIFRGIPGNPFVSEGLSGSGSFTVVPEPATLSLLGLGVLGLIRRRFAA